jgi:tRNA(adenine34) deaminase
MKWMQKAVDLARKCELESPIACIIVQNDKEIASSTNLVEKLQNPIAHAEMLCIQQACSILGSKYLDNCTLYCTLEPCEMCLEAARLAKIPKIIFGAFRAKRILYSGDIIGGIMEKECAELLTNFFESCR